MGWRGGGGDVGGNLRLPGGADEWGGEWASNHLS